MEELVKAQEELATRYRHEAKTIAERSEALVVELRAESERLSIRNAELSSQLSHAVTTNGQLDRSERDKSAQLVLLQKQLRESQALKTQQTAMIAQLRAAEQSYQAERKVLMRQAKHEARHELSASSQATTNAAPASAAGSRKLGAKEAAAIEVEQSLAAARLSQRAQPKA